MAMRHRVSTLRWSAVAMAAWLAGCSLIPSYQRPDAPVASQWPALPADTTPTEGPAAAELPWQDFAGDPTLRELIKLALTNNRDLRVAVLSIEQARAQYQIRRADQFPTLNLAFNGGRQGAANGSGDIVGSYSAGLSMTAWELDFFGRVSSLKEVALAQFLATQEARKAAQISLVAAVTSTWLTLRSDDELLALAQDTLTTREQSLSLTRLRFDHGASSALDLRQAESLAAAARVAQAQQQRLRAQDVNALTLLVGQPLPDGLVPPPPANVATADTGIPDTRGAATGTPSTAVAVAPAASAASAASAAPAAAIDASPLRDVPAGLPSDLLERRPDIRQAEQLLIAANANIGAARAAFFPRISLTAGLGSASSQLSGLFQNGSWGWTVGAQALMPIFDAGRNRAGLESATVARDIAVAQYEKSIQTAFREVADALAARATLGEQLQSQQAQVDAETERLNLAQLRYRTGVASNLELLDAQRSLFAVQQALAQVRLARQLNQVQLYKALGGGWTEPAAQTAAPRDGGR